MVSRGQLDREVTRTFGPKRLKARLTHERWQGPESEKAAGSENNSSSVGYVRREE